ncbi:MAG: PAS domain-containing protein, partial [Alphaproteobacteria bacterium]|nr:PAS domain-containing protein [Alphaproteobacteria bacterium]
MLDPLKFDPSRQVAAAAPLAVIGAGFEIPTAVMVIGGVLLLLAVAAVVTALRLMRDLVRVRRARDAAEAHGAMMDAAASGAPGAFWAWAVDAAADDPGTAGGNIGRLFGPGGPGVESFDDIIASFGGQGHALRDCVRALRRDGTMFAQTAESADGSHTFTTRGTRVGGGDDGGGYDVVWFRDISATIRESTSLRARNEELSALNAEYRNTLDHTGIPVWVRDKNLDLVYCNQAFAEVVEESSPAAAVAAAAEIVGGPAGWGRELAREAQLNSAAALRSAHVVANGRRRFMEITELPIGSGDSRWQVLGFAVDRTESDDMRAELDRHVMAHGEVLESLGTGIVIYGADTRLSFANTAFARLWGLDEEWLKTEPTHGEVLEDLRARRVYP